MAFENAVLKKRLASLAGSIVTVSENDAFQEPGQASIKITFADSTVIRADYWRLLKKGKQCLSSFDHQQQYGLPAPINAKAQLQNAIQAKAVTQFDIEGTGDINLQFAGDIALQIFNFTAYEVWEIKFPGGEVEFRGF